MKKACVFVCLCCLYSLLLAEFSYGLTGGMHSSGLKSESGTKGKSVSLPHLSFTLQFPFEEQFVFQPELCFLRQGADYDQAGVISRFRYSVWTLPLKLKYSIRKNSLAIQPYAGPELGYTMVAGSIIQTGSDELYIDLTGNGLDRMELGLVAGSDLIIREHFLCGVEAQISKNLKEEYGGIGFASGYKWQLMWNLGFLLKPYR